MGDESPGDDVEEFAGMLLPSISKQIKNILNEYPDDGQILKELVQNADDAGATELKVLYDRRDINLPKVGDKDLKKFFKGPALAVYNDAEFKPNDWKGIRMLGDSVKAEDPFKVGRFGLGFKSVFHLTDFPVIISNDRILFINPMEKNFNKVLRFVSLRKLGAMEDLDVKNCLEALDETFGFSEKTISEGRFYGTMFWFPLRESPSELSSNVFTKEKVLDLIHEFMAESHQMLLFLKSLHRVKWYVDLKTSTDKDGESDTLASYDLNKNKEFYSLEINNDAYLEARSAYIETVQRDERQASNIQVCHVATVSTRKKEVITDYNYLIIYFLMGTDDISKDLSILIADKDVSSLPFVGIAGPICENSIRQIKKRKGGHIFCFQPLPQVSTSLTGLPVHVNALFALSQNRRHLKWPSEDQMESHSHFDKFIRWNLSLVSEVLPIAYFGLLKAFIELSISRNNNKSIRDAFYHAIPFKTDEKWQPLARALLAKLPEENILFTESNSGIWIKASEAVIAREMSEIQEQDPLRSVVALLKQDNVNIVHVPKHVRDALVEITEIQEVNPSILVEHLREYDTYLELTAEQKDDLLTYICLEDDDSLLEDLELIPLADGSFTTFSEAIDEGFPVFVEPAATVSLFPSQKHRFVSNDISDRAIRLLRRLSDSGMFQLKRMEWDNLVDLLQATVEIFLACNEGLVSSISSEQLEGHSWQGHLKDIWKLVNDHFQEDDDAVLKVFKSLPLFPLSTGQGNGFHLHPLDERYLVGNKEHGLNNEVRNAFASLNVHIVARVPEFVGRIIRETFLHECSGHSIDILMSRLTSENIDAFNGEITSYSVGRSNSFISFLVRSLSEKDDLSSTTVLRKLCIWDQFDAINSRDSVCVCLEQNNVIYIDHDFPIPFPRKFILTQHVEFARIIGAETISDKDVTLISLQQNNKLCSGELQKFMLWLITDKKELLHHSEVKEHAKRIRFVLSGDGKLYKASELFDPSIHELKRMFSIDGKGFLPVDPKVLHGDCLQGLRRLGLKGIREVTPDDVEKFCNITSNHPPHMQYPFSKNVDALLRLLDTSRSDLLNKTKISSIPFIRVPGKREQTYPESLPFYNKNFGDKLFSPHKVKSLEFAHLIGSSMPLVDCQPFQTVAKFFKWNAQPSMESVLEHLIVISETYTHLLKSHYLYMITQIYEWLDRNCNLTLVKKYLDTKFEEQNTRCLWTGDGFDVAKSIVVDYAAHEPVFAPFLNKIDRQHAERFKGFFIAMGCVPSATLNTYVQTLYRIKEANDMNTNVINKDEMRNMAISILNLIKRKFSSEELGSCDTIYVPIQTENEDLQMMDATVCTYCDADWLHDDGEDIIYVHSDLPNSTAEAIGVRSLTGQFLSESEGIEEWGQTEPLTRRLRTLLKHNYIDGFTIPKELFQNADDAGATSMSILYDERENEECRSNLLSPGMADLQGPALWVHNDAEFTDADFLHITKLNGATKERDSSKIGRFGLGFNSVYNITDVPSILSRDKIVIFDPHTKFLGNALPGRSPGLKIDLSRLKNQRMMKKCINQFRPYEGVFGCELVGINKPLFKGTLFRFPLRTIESEISNDLYTRDDVVELIQKIVQFAGNMFIFSQNVQCLKLLHLPKSASSPCEAKLIFECTQRKKRVSSPSDPAMTVLKEASLMKRRNELQRTAIKVIDVVVISTKIQPSSTDLIASTNKKNLNNTTTWLVSWFSGTESSTWKLVQSEEGALPLGAVSVPVNKKEFSVLTMSDLPKGFYNISHVFFFLPLPISHDLPFHINGQFAVTSDRRHLQVSSDDDKSTKMTEWNDCLLQDAITKAFVGLLQKIGSMASTERYNFYDIWPLHMNTDVSVKVSESFYKMVVRDLLAVFESDGNWWNISQCLFLDPELRQKHPEIAVLALKVTKSTTTEKTIIDIPIEYYDHLLKVDREIIKSISIDKNDFLLKYFLPNLQNCHQFLSIEERNEILYFAVEQQKEEINNWLKNNDCIPTKPDGKLIRPSKLIHSDSPVSALFSEEDMRFPFDQFETKLQAELLHLGMQRLNIEDEDVIDRAKTVTSLNNYCSTCARERYMEFAKYMSNHLKSHANTFSVLKETTFIPAMEKPRAWTFPWYLDSFHQPDNPDMTRYICSKHSEQTTSIKFLAPKDLYSKRHKNIVGCLHCVADSVTCDGNSDFEENVGVNDIIATDTVIEQLRVITANFDNSHKKGGASTIINDLYQLLDRRCKNDENIIATALEGKCIVFVNGLVQNTRNVAKELYNDCAPFVYSLRNSPLKHYGMLCKCLEIKDHCSIEFLSKFLMDLYHESEGVPLEKTQLKSVLTLLRYLHERLEVEKQEPVNQDITLFIPDEKGCLKEATNLCFDDGYKDIPKSHEMIFAHPQLSPAQAKAFGVMPKVERFIYNLSEDIDGGQEFFQEEPLVRRIHNLLEGYPCDVSIFKELLQNADDAGANEIHFVNDSTHHGVTNLMDSGCSGLQGPALCVFNDSAFTKDDLLGITQLGKGSKCDDPVKTGQYGVGFNAVYNLTDAPSFLTKGDDLETLCIFDPLAKYLNKATRSKPGRRFNLETLRYKKDTMSGYHEKALMKGDRGTVFRFPLRSKESEIADSKPNSEYIGRLLEDFIKQLPEMLLFQKNLGKVLISNYTQAGLKEIYCIETRLSGSDWSKRNSFTTAYRSMCADIKLNRQAMFKASTSKSVISELSIIQNNSPFKTYHVIQTFGFENPQEIPQLIQDAVGARTIGLFPIGGVALCVNDDKAEQLAHLSRSKVFCFLPLPSETGLPMHVNGHFALDHETRRGLWKPEKDRSDICEKFQWNLALIKQIIVPSYVKVLKHRKEHLFSQLEERWIDYEKLMNVLKKYESMFPSLDNVTEDYWKFFLTSTYQYLIRSHEPFLPCLRIRSHLEEKQLFLSWTVLMKKESVFPAYHYELEKEKSDLLAILNEIGIRLFSTTKNVYQAIKFAGFTFEDVSPESVVDFLKSHSSSDEGSCNIAMNAAVSETSLKDAGNTKILTGYCLKGKEYFLQQITYMPLVMSQDEHLQEVNENDTIFVTKFVHLFKTVPSLFKRFVHESLVLEYSQLCQFPKSVFKVLDIPDFISICQKTQHFSGICKSSIIPWDKKHPSVEWINRALRFVFGKVSDESSDAVAKSVQQVLKEIETLSLLPVESDNVHYLYPIEKIQWILSSELRGNTALKNVLERCKIPKLNKAILMRGSSKIHDMVCNVIPDFRDPKAVVQCLLNNIERLKAADLTTDEARTLLDYVSSNKGKFEKQTHHTDLRRLPMFIMHDGKPISIDDKKMGSVIVLPQVTIPSEGLNDMNENVFLKDIRELRPLHLFLDLRCLDVVDIFTNVIFPNHRSMRRSDFYEHVCFALKYGLKSTQIHLDKICSSIRDLRFINHDDHQSLKRIQDLFNPAHNIFLYFCEEHELLPKALQGKELCNVLVDKLGLQNEMTLELFERFARNMTNATAICKEMRQKSSMLFQEIVSMDKSFFQNNNFKNVTSARFIAAESVKEMFTSICPSYKQNCLTSLNESVVSSKCGLCWTTSPLLPSEFEKILLLRDEQDMKMIEEKLSIKHKPDINVFVQHCKQLGMAISGKLDPEKKTDYQAIWKDIYQAFSEYLKEKKLERDDDLLKQLKEVPLVYFPDRNLLVQAALVINDCTDEDEIPPYIYKAPTKFGEYHVDVFCLLGSSSRKSWRNYATVLEAMAKDINYKPLLPQERGKAIQATQHLISCLQKETEEELQTVDKLYLPSCDETLEPSKQIVICDSGYFKKRLHNQLPSGLRYFIQCEVLTQFQETIIECFKTLKEGLQPLMLTDIVRETFKKDSFVQKSQREAVKVMDFLRSPEFIGGYLRLIKNSFRGTEAEWEEVAVRIQRVIRKIELRHVANLVTVLERRNFVDGEFTEYKVVEGTEEQSLIHLFMNHGSVVILFQTTDKLWYSEVRDTVAKHLSECLPSGYDFDLNVFSLSCKVLDQWERPDGISSLLDKHHIKMYTMKVEARQEVFPKPGTYVPREYHQYLDNGYEIDEADFLYMAFELEDDADEFGINVNDEETCPTFVFARVLSKRNSTASNILFHEYEVDIGGSSTRVVQQNRLYTFRRKKGSDDTQTAGLELQVFIPNKDDTNTGLGASSKPVGTLKEAYKEVRDNLKEAWKQPEKQRKQIVKRLVLKWHPDKNPDRQEFCTKVFQYIQQCLKRLEEGKDLLDDTEDNSGDDSAGARYQSSSDWFRSNETYGSFYRNWDSYNHGSGYRTGDFFSESTYTPYRYPAAAKRWLRQAKDDLCHANGCIQEIANPFYNWICFIGHQAAEKSLTAAWYANDANKINGKKYNHDIKYLASGLTSQLQRLSSDLCAVTGNYNSMRYPEDTSLTDTTAKDRYTRRMATMVLDIAQEIVETVERTYDLNT